MPLDCKTVPQNPGAALFMIVTMRVIQISVLAASNGNGGSLPDLC
jgi:hypothetical protein